MMCLLLSRDFPKAILADYIGRAKARPQITGAFVLQQRVNRYYFRSSAFVLRPNNLRNIDLEVKHMTKVISYPQ